jgi:hypothetical protein
MGNVGYGIDVQARATGLGIFSFASSLAAEAFNAWGDSIRRSRLTLR